MSGFQHRFDPSILREYDLRGVVGKTLFEADAYALGRVFGSFIARQKGSKIGICYDGRHSSPGFAKQLMDGLAESGINVENFGLGPTPMAYFGLYHRDLDAVVIITGSHNPPEYNGLKMMLRGGKSVYGAMIKEFGALAEKGDVISDAKRGTVTDVSIIDAYVARLAGDYRDNGQPPLKVVWDAGNGATGAVLQQLTNALPGTHILLFEDVDGAFPNHHPDPAVEKNLVDLKQAVASHGADLGIAFDGDGDRIGAVTRNGDVVWSDQLITLYAHDILDRQPEASFILDVKCSQAALDKIAALGGKPSLWKAGHSLVKARMQETGAALGGELSGHIFFKEGFYGHDDALYCAVRLLNVVQKYGDLAKQLAEFPALYNTPEVRFDVPEEDKFGIVERATAALKKNVPPGVSVLDIDGLRVSDANGWWMLRASNTQNAITVRAEGTTPDGLARVIKSLEAALDQAECVYPQPLFG